MPFLIQVGAQVMCAHGGQAQATVPYPRVLLSGQPAVQQPNPWVIAGCAFPPPPAGNGPCITAMWSTGTVRVMGGGMPLLMQSSMATCIPTGTPTMVVMTQMKVQAT